ncbi:MAG TPA: hypothetical protein VJ907_00160 [Halanaerobiales bacterium]|nr:hypothetical protein [Halanaerobiales bacterium]
MDKTNVILILIDKRTDAALKVQEILTENGCIIKTRLGMHETSNCAEEGLIFLNVKGSEDNINELIKELDNIKRVDAKLVKMSISDKKG